MQLEHGDLRLRALRRADRTAWYGLRRRNMEWLKRWDATLPMPDSTVPVSYMAMVRYLRREGRAGRSLSFGMEYRGGLVGQVTLGGISWGSLRSGYVGYWVDKDHAGMGLTPLAVAMVCDHAFNALRLHRLEINLRTENEASKRVVAKLGFGFEGMRPRYLHIDGAWRDHLCYVLFQGDQPEGVVSRLESGRTSL